MNKFLKLCKKPFLIAFSVMFMVSMIALIVLCVIPNASKYSFKDSFAGQTMKIDITLKSNNEVDLDMFLSGMQNVSETISGKYRISDGKIYFQKDNDDLLEYGSINNFEIVPNLKALQEYGLNSYPDIKFKNNTNITLKNISIVFMCVFGVVALGCLVVLILSKTGVLKDENQETVESVIPQ